MVRKAVLASRSNAEKILVRLKGLVKHLQPNEEPTAAFPAIWDNGQSLSSALCDVVITNQRIIGFYFRSFPREKLFFDALALSSIKSVTLRQKSHEPMFRELLINEENRKVYIRAPRKKIEDLYAALRAAIDQYGSTGRALTSEEQTTEAISTRNDATSEQGQASLLRKTVYGRQDIETPFEMSIMAIVLLFVGGIVLEIVGAMLWSVTHDSQVGFPLCLAGFVAVSVSIWLKRRQR